MTRADLPPIVGTVRDAIADATRGLLVGVYVYGSPATDGSEPHVSDIDPIAVLNETPDAPLVERLEAMHERLARFPTGAIASRSNTSLGRDSHIAGIDAGRDFLLEWYPARRDGVNLIGPPIDDVIPETPEVEYLDEVRAYLAGLPGRLDDASPGWRSYAVLTMCRGLSTLRSRERLSKREAAMRARREFPRWSQVIDGALAWRDQPRNDMDGMDAPTAHETEAFLTEMARLLERPPPAPDHIE